MKLVPKQLVLITLIIWELSHISNYWYNANPFFYPIQAPKQRAKRARQKKKMRERRRASIYGAVVEFSSGSDCGETRIH